MNARFGTARRTAKRNQLRMRDGDNCWLCGKPMRFSKGDGLDPEFATLDHVIPKSAGGTLVLSNLKLAHGRCNKARANAPAIADQSPKGRDAERLDAKHASGGAEGNRPTSSAHPLSESPHDLL